MTTWNYRITKHMSTHLVGPSPTEVYEIREVYYDEHGQVENYSKDPISPHGDSITELMEDVRLMCLAEVYWVIDLDQGDEFHPVTKQRRPAQAGPRSPQARAERDRRMNG